MLTTLQPVQNQLATKAPLASPTFTGTTTCNNLAVSGSRLEVATSLTNTQLDGFNSIYFHNTNTGASPTETGQIFCGQSAGLNLCTNTPHPIRLNANQNTEPNTPSLEISDAGTKTYLSMLL